MVGHIVINQRLLIHYHDKLRILLLLVRRAPQWVTHSLHGLITLITSQGRHVLLHCVESGVGVAAVRHILQEGYSELVALRDQVGVGGGGRAIFTCFSCYPV